jgi:hypothetical protein
MLGYSPGPDFRPVDCAENILETEGIAMLHRPGLATLAAAFVLVAAQGWGATPVAAQAGPAAAALSPAAAAPAATPDDPYSVSGVEVDVTAASAAEARDKAILEAQRKAFGVLFKRLSPDGGSRIAPAVRDADLQRMIQGFEIERERGSAVRYVGTLAFKFRPRAVRTYLSSIGVQAIEPAAPRSRPGEALAPSSAAAAAAPAGVRPTLVLPVTGNASSGYQLWEERTVWRTAWEDFAAAAGAARVVVPAGELADIADIGAAEAVNGNPAALARIAAHYQAGDVVVAVLNPPRLDQPTLTNEVVLNRFGASGQPEGAGETLTVAGTANEAPAGTLARTVSTVVDRLASLPRSAPAPTAASGDGQLQANVQISGLQDWQEVRRRLTSNPMVASVELLSLARTQVQVLIRYRGEPDALRAMLDRDSLTLVSAPTGWTLHLKSSAQPSSGGTSAPAALPAPRLAPAAPAYQPPAPTYQPPSQAYPAPSQAYPLPPQDEPIEPLPEQAPPEALPPPDAQSEYAPIEPQPDQPPEPESPAMPPPGYGYGYGGVPPEYAPPPRR